MSIKTYGLALMSRWQSALYKTLSDDQTHGAENARELASEHPAMIASCEACETLEKAISEGRDSVDIAEVVTKGALASKCAHMYVGLAAARFTGNHQRVKELESEIRYSVCDPLWAKALLEFDSGHQAIPYRHYETYDDFVLPLDNAPISIAFVSDWGTGTPLARNVMRRIAEQKPDVLIHLGDVYYSGTHKEMDEHFLSIVREYLPASTRVFNLAGNHDLYAGGAGYYWLIDELGQPASYFCLRNQHWQILAIGAPPEAGSPHKALSAIPSIDPQEVQWHQHQIENYADRKTVMLSHYQLFTASGNIGRTPDNRPLALNPVLYEAFKPHLADIDLWLWGHEHNLIAFEPYAGLRKGRCIGSGAIPVALLWQPYKQLPNLSIPDHIGEAPRIDHACRLDHDGDHYHHAFGLLNIDGSHGQMNYFQVAGVEGGAELIFTESI